MTEDEHNMIAEIRSSQDQLNKQHAEIMQKLERFDKLYDAFLGVPVGAGEDAKPLLVVINNMATTYVRGSWFARMVIFGTASFLGALVLLGNSLADLKDWFIR